MWEEANQGQVGNCYIIANLSSAAEYPNLIRNMFVNKLKNEQGIYLIKFYIRGKPWVVSVDDRLPVYEYWGTQQLIFTKPADGTMWAPLIEKAWAKVKGTYLQTDGGFNANGLRSITGAPVEFQQL